MTDRERVQAVRDLIVLVLAGLILVGFAVYFIVYSYENFR
jgi:hypothetical protein